MYFKDLIIYEYRIQLIWLKVTGACDTNRPDVQGMAEESFWDCKSVPVQMTLYPCSYIDNHFDYRRSRLRQVMTRGRPLDTSESCRFVYATNNVFPGYARASNIATTTSLDSASEAFIISPGTPGLSIQHAKGDVRCQV